jgi:hypothetical protein
MRNRRRGRPCPVMRTSTPFTWIYVEALSQIPLLTAYHRRQPVRHVRDSAGPSGTVRKGRNPDRLQSRRRPGHLENALVAGSLRRSRIHEPSRSPPSTPSRFGPARPVRRHGPIPGWPSRPGCRPSPERPAARSRPARAPRRRPPRIRSVPTGPVPRGRPRRPGQAGCRRSSGGGRSQLRSFAYRPRSVRRGDSGRKTSREPLGGTDSTRAIVNTCRSGFAVDVPILFFGTTPGHPPSGRLSTPGPTDRIASEFSGPSTVAQGSARTAEGKGHACVGRAAIAHGVERKSLGARCQRKRPLDNAAP